MINIKGKKNIRLIYFMTKSITSCSVICSRVFCNLKFVIIWAVGLFITIALKCSAGQTGWDNVAVDSSNAEFAYVDRYKHMKKTQNQNKDGTS